MNKKVMAIAVAGLFAAPAVALAQKSTVEIYGRANLAIDYWKADGATAGPTANLKGRVRIVDGSSRVGFRGVEDLGQGLRAIFQIESGINIDNGQNTGQSGSQNLSSGTFASRDSFVGIDSNFGRLTFGRQSIYWANGIFFQAGANYTYTDLPFLTGTLSRVGVGVARNSNTLQYTTPTVGGFNATLSYSPDSSGTGTATNGVAVPASCLTTGFVNSECVGGGRNTNARIIGATLRGAVGAFAGQLDIVERKTASDIVVGNGVPKNQGIKFLAGWSYMPGAILSVQLQQAKNDNVGTTAGYSTAGDDVKAQSWALHWEHTFGNIQPYVEYGQVQKVKGCTESAGAVPGVSGSTCRDTEVRAFGLGVRYFLSKRTWLYALYNQTDNKANANNDNTGGNVTSANPLPVGADPRLFGAGIFHNF